MFKRWIRNVRRLLYDYFKIKSRRKNITIKYKLRDRIINR